MRNRIDIEAVMKRHDDEYDYIQRMHEADIEQKSKEGANTSLIRQFTKVCSS